MTIVACARCGAKNRVDERVTFVGKQPVCGRCGATLGDEGRGGANAAGERTDAYGGWGWGTNEAGTSSGAAAASSGASAEARPLNVSDATFAREVVEASSARPVLLDCWAAWCGPCRMVAPVLDELAAESAGRYRVAKLDVDANPRTSAALRIQSIPTLFIYKNGQPVERITGAQPKHVLAARLAAFL